MKFIERIRSARSKRRAAQAERAAEQANERRDMDADENGMAEAGRPRIPCAEKAISLGDRVIHAQAKVMSSIALRLRCGSSARVPDGQPTGGCP
jgi:hypothetical protein